MGAGQGRGPRGRAKGGWANPGRGGGGAGRGLGLPPGGVRRVGAARGRRGSARAARRGGRLSPPRAGAGGPEPPRPEPLGCPGAPRGGREPGLALRASLNELHCCRRASPWGGLCSSWMARRLPGQVRRPGHCRVRRGTKSKALDAADVCSLLAHLGLVKLVASAAPLWREWATPREAPDQAS